MELLSAGFRAKRRKEVKEGDRPWNTYVQRAIVRPCESVWLTRPGEVGGRRELKAGRYAFLQMRAECSMGIHSRRHGGLSVSFNRCACESLIG